MFISDLFEAQQRQTLVIIPGGFHPFHPGHLSLYRSAESAFPGATIVYAATDDRKERPFAFADKQKLAQIAGVKPDHFQLVKSPFVCKEITQNFDPNNTVLIFARSEKDRDEQPKPGGIKKDGSPSYLQPYTKGNLAPMAQHGYMAYLPVVQFDAGPSGVTSATQIREMWPRANDQQKAEIVKDLYPKNPKVAMQILNKYLGGAVAEEWSQKYKSSINCAHPKGFSQKAHCAGKKKHNESIEMEDVCPDCGMCQTHGDHSKDKLDELKCWSGYHRVAGTKAGFPGSCAKNKTNEEGVAEGLGKSIKRAAQGWGGSQDKPVDIVKRNKAHDTDTAKRLRAGMDDAPEHTPQGLQKRVLDRKLKGVAEEKCPHCAGPMFSEMMMNEKKDACYYKVKSRYKVWPSAYASGALVKCRKSHGKWGTKSESIDAEQLEENLHKWFKEKWVRFGPDGKIRGDCARGDDSEGKPKCLPQSKAHALGKKGRASAASRKRREDPNPERSGKAINVNTKKKSNEDLTEKSVSKAQFRTMAAAAHNPKFAKKVDIGQNVAKEFHSADKKQSYKKLPARVEGKTEQSQLELFEQEFALLQRSFKAR
jgi:glycerol-3-phosphate cytidylyltransferase-like family protein